MVKSGSMVTGCPDRPEHRMQISHRDATLRPNLSPKLHARQPKLVYSELFRASLGAGAKGVATHWPVASNSKPWKGQTSRPPHICPPAAGPRSAPRCGQTASATQTRPLSSHQTTMFSPIQVFWMSLAFSTLRRVAMKYQPSGNGGWQRCVRRLPTLGCHRSTLLTRNLGAMASLPAKTPA